MKLSKSLKSTLILLTIIFIFIFVASYSVQKVTNPGFCQLCHEIYPEYKTWQASPHNKVDCVKCHSEYNPRNNSKAITLLINEITLHITKKYNKPIQTRVLMDSQACINCHSGKIDPKRAYKFSHPKHESQKINCTICHAGVAHGKLVERGQTREEKYDSYETVSWEKEMTPENTKPNMNSCLKCHMTENKPIDCQFCHSKITKPNSHMRVDWVDNHSIEAFDQINSCEKCHINELLINNESKILNIDTYARTTSFCSDCHMKRPAGHTANWLKEHGKKAKLSRISCLVCHRENKGVIPQNQKVVQVSCSDCHK